MIDQLLRFEPILKEKIWGGEKLMSLLHKSSEQKNVGESWEISDVEEEVSIVSNGELKGTSLQELLKVYTTDLLGKSVYQKFGEKFPLLIKFIDAKEALSIQLHPNDELAKKRHNSFGKTEMWYVMQGDEGANLIVGFKKNVDANIYKHHLQHKSLLEILNVDQVSEGDVYFIPTGRVHAIGAGVLLAEIQQTSDITYRIYDWDRQDTEGNYRELHTEEAIDAIDYKAKSSYRTTYSKETNTATEVVSCPYFTTNILPVEGTLELNHKNKDSFVIYMCVKGSVTFTYTSQEEQLQMGETILIPACMKDIKITSKAYAEVLEIYIKS